MSKPDWAERLQRTFKRKYKQGVADENARIVGLITEEFFPYETVRIRVRDLVTLITVGKDDKEGKK